jgi:hypothetical protein
MDKVSRPTCRSVGLLAGRVHLIGTSRTLVGGDPWVPMSHTWRSPPPMESRLPHSHLYPSPKRFPMESHLLLGCSHKIPNGTSSAFDLSRCRTATSNTILGLCSQGLSRHVLPHVAPGFFAGRGCKGWWSSSNFASILLASRDDISDLCSGGRTKSKGILYYQAELPWRFH